MSPRNSRRFQDLFKMYHQVRDVLETYSTCFRDLLQRRFSTEICCYGTNFPRVKSLDMRKILEQFYQVTAPTNKDILVKVGY